MAWLESLLSFCPPIVTIFYALIWLIIFPPVLYTVSHILEQEFFCLGCLGRLGRLSSQGSNEKKWIWGILSNLWGRFFQLFVGKKEFRMFSKIFQHPHWKVTQYGFYNFSFFFWKSLKKLKKEATTQILIFSVIQRGAFKSHCL